MSNEKVYLDLLRNVYENGVDRPDRTGVGVKGLFGSQSRYDLTASFPLLTTKKLDLKSISSELLWFVEGSGDERRLAEIRYGKPRSALTDKKTIWTANAEAAYWKDKAAFEGDLGRVYGMQWRNWTNSKGKKVDQLANLIDGLKRDPFGRRHILSAWNPGELDQMALPPCHIMAQFYVVNGKLSCQLYQRSGDCALGIPYNIASYALFTHMVAQVCGYKVGEFIHTVGDVHIYHDHFDGVEEQLSRKPKSPPHLFIDPTIKNIDEFTMDSFDIMGYAPHPNIKLKMAV